MFSFLCIARQKNFRAILKCLKFFFLKLLSKFSIFSEGHIFCFLVFSYHVIIIEKQNWECIFAHPSLRIFEWCELYVFNFQQTVHQSTNIAYLKCLRLKFMILIVDLEIEIARWIYDYLNISSCKHFQSVLFFFLNIFCIKLAYLLTTSLTLRLRLKIVFFWKYLFWLRVLPCGPWNWDYKTYLRLPSLNISSCKRFQLNNCQNGTFKSVHEIWHFFGQKCSFEALLKCQ